ncbi:MAG TPA: MBL fold metallo-hydrolase RNA specificity domain-containing protein [Pirellulaceae bacterium]|nr:MBL fold metallo-hydrolase RNA specificity domain-containing protein [Pirellulaceae bacterium]
MFHFDGGLKITSIDLAVDFRRRQPRGFISHAHTDHMGRHELAYCTPATAALYQRRYGPRPTRLMLFGEPLQWNGLTLTALPAGHVFGSAMLHVSGEQGTLLYTGDFKLRPSATAEAATLPRADVLIMECTYGTPRYRLPPRDEAIAQLLMIVQRVLAAGRTPVVRAYVLGKAQEVTRILTAAGLRVVQHPLVHEISLVYQQCGCDLGTFERLDGPPPEDAVVVAPPRNQKAAHMIGLRRPVSIAVSGWAVDPGCRWLAADYAVPLSDHADFDELVECVERTEPAIVFCTHGPAGFVEELRRRGHNAHPLEDCRMVQTCGSFRGG